MVCDNKEGGGRPSQLRYNVLLPVNTLQSPLQHSEGRGEGCCSSSDKINIMTAQSGLTEYLHLEISAHCGRNRLVIAGY